MEIIKKGFKFLIYTMLVFMIFFMGLYSLIIFKPESIINLNNYFEIFDYKAEFKSVQSNKNFIKPEYSFSELKVKDHNKNYLLSIDEFLVGFNLYRTISEDFWSISKLKIDNISILNSQLPNEEILNSNKIQLTDIEIKNNNFYFISAKTYVFQSNGETSINVKSGKINNTPFKKLNIFIPRLSENIFYNGIFYLDETEIINQNLINLSSFSDTDINLDIQSKGYYVIETGQIRNINKFIFRESTLKTNTNYLIRNIDIDLFSDVNGSLHGTFDSDIPDQYIQGSLSVKDGIELRTKLAVNLNNIFNDDRYFGIQGNELFQALLKVQNSKLSLLLESDLKKTKFSSAIDEISKDFEETLKTTVVIDDLRYPSYLISNNLFKAFIDNESNGFFHFGNGFTDEQIFSSNDVNGFNIFLNLEKIEIENLIVDSSDNNSSKLRSIFIKTKELNLFNNYYPDQKIIIQLDSDETNANFSGVNLNGNIRIDKTGFTRIEVFDTKFEFDGFSLAESGNSFENQNLRIRFIGKNIQTYDDTFQDVDFYLLRNKNITTIDNINIKSEKLNIGPFRDEKKAYISFDNRKDLYKVRGSYVIDAENFPFKDSINYDFDYLSSDLSIQWNSLNELKNLEGEIAFLIKGLESKTSLPDSAFLRALRILNLNAIIENINNDSSLASSDLIINRAEGDFVISQNRAFINKPIKLSTSEANIEWYGEILKNSDGILDDLNLDLSMRLKVSENIPWYAAIFGGFPALAGGLLFENIIEESLDDVSTFKFEVTGNIQKPEIKRLN